MGGLLLGIALDAVHLVTASISPAIPLGIAIGLEGAVLVSLLIPQLPLPSRFRQVSSAHLLRGNEWRAGWRWGIELGTGFLTHSITPLLYGVVALALVAGSFGALLIPAAYGFARAVAIAASAIVQALTYSVSPAGERVNAAPLWQMGLAARLRLPSAALVATTLILAASQVRKG